MTDIDTAVVGETIRQIAPDDLVAGDNIRRDLGDLDGLAASIAATGVHEPLIVRPTADGLLEVVAGHRRLAAARQVDLDTVPVVVREITDDERDEIMLIENLQRSDLAPLDEATGYARLVQRGMTQTHLADRVGRSRKHVGDRLRLLAWPDLVLDLVTEGLDLKQAERLVGIVNHDSWDAAVEEHAAGEPLDVLRQLAAKPNPSWEFDTLVRTAERAATVAAARQRATDDGLVWVDVVKTKWHHELPDGHEWTGHLFDDPDIHVDEPCHAVTCHPNDTDGTLEGVCTDPSRHDPDGDGPTAEVHTRRADRAAADARRDAEIAAAEERRRAAVTAVLEHATQTELTRVVLAWAVHSLLEHWSLRNRLHDVADAVDVAVDEYALDALFTEAATSVAAGARIAAAGLLTAPQWSTWVDELIAAYAPDHLEEHVGDDT